MGDCVKRILKISLPLYAPRFEHGFGGSVLPYLIVTSKRPPGEENAPFLRLLIRFQTILVHKKSAGALRSGNPHVYSLLNTTRAEGKGAAFFAFPNFNLPRMKCTSPFMQ